MDPQSTPQPAATPTPQFGPPVPPPTENINQLVREVQLTDGIDVGRTWYSTLKIDPQADVQTMFNTFREKYDQDFPYLELPDETTKRFPKQAAMDLGAKIIRPGEVQLSYEAGVQRGFLPVEAPMTNLPADELADPNPPANPNPPVPPGDR